MTGSSLTLAIGSALACAAYGAAILAGAAAHAQQTAGAADNAAIAAASTAAGFSPGSACDNAQRVAETFNASLETCTAHGLTVTVTVSKTFGAFTASATARAGPPSDRTRAPRSRATHRSAAG